jgi:hypothetical protein
VTIWGASLTVKQHSEGRRAATQAASRNASGACCPKALGRLEARRSDATPRTAQSEADTRWWTSATSKTPSIGAPEQACAEADQMLDPKVKRALQGIAENYDQLAERTEAMVRSTKPTTS